MPKIWQSSSEMFLKISRTLSAERMTFRSCESSFTFFHSAVSSSPLRRMTGWYRPQPPGFWRNKKEGENIYSHNVDVLSGQSLHCKNIHVYTIHPTSVSLSLTHAHARTHTTRTRTKGEDMCEEVEVRGCMWWHAHTHTHTHTYCFHNLISVVGQRIKLFIHGVSPLTRVFNLGQVVDVLQPSSRLSPRLGNHLLHFIIVLQVREG